MNATNGPKIGWAVLASIFHVLALVSTVIRLVHRLRMSRIWWDDYMVVLPLVMNSIYFASLWVLYSFQREEDSDTMLPPTGISSFWASIFIFLSVVWPCRISVVLSFARVFPALHKARRSAFFIAVICVLSYLCCVFILTFECPSDAPWYKTVTSHCHKTGSTFVSRVVGGTLDLTVDVIIILFPIITLWKVKLPLNLRRIIISAFSGSALTLITALVFFIIGYDSDLNLGPDTATIIRLAGHLEAAISLLVTNLLVIVSFFYRIFRRVHDLEGTEPPITRNPPSPVTDSKGTIGLGRETSIGQVSVLDTDDRPLSTTLTRFSQLVWSSMQVSEPPCLLSQNMSGG